MSSHTLKLLPLLLLGIYSLPTAFAYNEDALPEIGTAASSTLSINQEIFLGDYYIRQLRGGAPMLYDPLLNDYATKLGQRLVAQAQSVKTPFFFHWIRNNQINAFAFFGGHIVLHNGLLTETEDESQLASVIAHEIVHITQRHLARTLESQQKSNPVFWASTLGSILLTMANPAAGIAALSGTIAGAQQGVISFTQSNEQEADRIGLQILSKAGFDVMGMPNFMQKISEKYRYTTRPPEMLLTHPLPTSRLSDTRNRANQMKRRAQNSSIDYYLAKTRSIILYSNADKNAIQFQLDLLKKGNALQKTAAQYGEALYLSKNSQHTDARRLLQPLLSNSSNNVWYLDLMSDIDINSGQPQLSIARLENALKGRNNIPILQLNLANAYLSARQYQAARTVLNRYTFAYPNDINGWDLLSKANGLLRLNDEEYAARAEILALTAQFDRAINLLTSAVKQGGANAIQRSRNEARIAQLKALQARFKKI